MSFEVSNIRNGILLFVALCYLFASGYSKQVGKRNGNSKSYKANEIELLRRSKAADIKSWIEATEDPCNDFYNHVCGNWPRIYADEVLQQGTISKYSELNRAMDKKVAKFIGSLRPGDAIEGKIRNFYNSCLNAQADACEYIEDLKALYEGFGKFSFLKKKGAGKSKNTFNLWWNTVAEIYSMYGYGFIIDIKVDYGLGVNSKNLMIYLEEPKTIVHSKDKTLVEVYLRRYHSASVEDAQQVVNEMLTFEKAMSEAKNQVDDEANETQYSLHNLSAVHRQYRDLFDVESFLKTALNLNEVPAQIYIKNGGYFDHLLTILEKTKADTVEDYILWGLTAKYSIDVEAKDMKSLCAWITNFYFSEYTQHSIYEEFRSSEFENQIYELWQDIKGVLLQDLQNEKYPWMSNGTRNLVIQKVNGINFKISSYDEENFEESFRGLQIDSLKYVNNLQNIHKHIHEQRVTNIQKISQSMENFEDYFFSAFYVSHLNEVRIPVAFLLPFHLWHPAYPKAILYATIGTSLAHEMIHAVEDTSNLWDADTANALEERRNCLQLDIDLPSDLEHIVDNSAVKIAYSAYMYRMHSVNQTQGNLSGETFPGMSYNNQELFFIAYGQRWCEGTVEDELDKIGENKLKVNGVLSNFQEFSDVFKCAKDAVMNPVKKCEIF